MSREVINPIGLREDGRRAGDLRYIACDIGVLEGVDGSCLYTQGNTKVLASVIGPYEARGSGKRGDVQQAVVECQYMAAPFATMQRRDLTKGTRAAKEVSLLLQQTFEAVIQTSLFPQSTIRIHVLVLQNHGGAVACAINAATVALMHAAIPMRSVVAAVTASIAAESPLLDLNSSERARVKTQLTVASERGSRAVLALQTEARLSVPHFEAALELALDGCDLIADKLRGFVRAHVHGAQAAADAEAEEGLDATDVENADVLLSVGRSTGSSTGSSSTSSVAHKTAGVTLT